MAPLAQSRIVADLAVRMAAMELQQAATAKAANETTGLVKEIHDCLMKQQPGHDGSFMDRATTLLLNVESGERVMGWVIAVGKLVIAMGVIFSVIVAVIAAGKVGIWPEGKP